MLRKLSILSSSLELRAFASSAADHVQPSVSRGTKWRQDLKVRVRKSFQTEGEESEDKIFAGVILERYPICLSPLPAWKEDFIAWQAEWNKWKYKVPKPGWLDVGKPTGGDSMEVRFTASLGSYSTPAVC
jgi:hypothetical protein